MAQAKLIYVGTKANLPEVASRENAFYLLNDTREVYFGGNLYSEAVRYFTSTEQAPKPANPAQGVLYVDTVNGNGYSWNGSAWQTVFTGTAGIAAQLIGESTDAASANTIYGAKKYAADAVDAAKEELIGDNTDTKDSDTIEGAKRYADDVQSTLEGNASTDTYNSTTIAGAKKYADKKAEDLVGTAGDTSADDTIKGAKALANSKVASIAASDGVAVDDTDPTAPEISVKLQENNNDLAFNANGELFYKAPNGDTYAITKDATSSDYAAVYHLMKNGETECGVAINIPKDKVVESGSVVEVTDQQAGTEGYPATAGTYIRLVLQNVTDPLWINVGDLIEYVTSGSQAGDMVVISIDAQHRVTATITDGTITLAKLTAEVQAKINQAHEHANKAVLDGITAAKVQNWDDAYTAVQIGSF